eukprot:759091-Hanusia_phi.AAC.1
MGRLYRSKWGVPEVITGPDTVIMWGRRQPKGRSTFGWRVKGRRGHVQEGQFPDKPEEMEG